MKHLANLLLIGLAVMSFFSACQSDQSSWPESKNWAWMYIGRDFAEPDWPAQLDLMKNSGIDGILLLTRGEDEAEFAEVANMIKASGMELHIWIPVMNPHGADSLETLHPDWYVVSREGKSCLDDPPYIPSYKWLCPNTPGVLDYLVQTMDELASRSYVDGVHLDYIRFPDVILPIGLQPKYDLVQDHEFPEFDFCYCEHCRSKFKAQTGIDPLDLEDPAANQDWVNFRYQSITSVVEQIAERVHARQKVLTAAVFPTPDIARTMVRQDWTQWNLDEVMPMMYHQYYNEPLAWIEEACVEGTSALQGKFPLYAGLFINEISPEDFDDAVNYAKNGGAAGLCLFNANGMSLEQWEGLHQALK